MKKMEIVKDNSYDQYNPYTISNYIYPAYIVYNLQPKADSTSLVPYVSPSLSKTRSLQR